MRRFWIVSHRWLSLVLGLVLLLVTTSGAVLLYKPEVMRALDHEAYDPTGGPQLVSFETALDTVRSAHRDFEPTGVVLTHGILKVHNADYRTFWSVDPTKGRILGEIHAAPRWIQLLDNVHECFLSCEGETGYVPAMAKQVPHSAWMGFDGGKVTYGGLVLGVLGVVLLYLCLTGLWLWFPRPGKWRSSMSVRWSRGRFARDTDLHKVCGMLVLLPLLIWGVTGAGFELGFVEKAWYALTPGTALPDAEPATSKKSSDPDIGADEAVKRVEQVYGRGSVFSVDLPDPKDATASYDLWVQRGFDPYGQADYPGNVGVSVERHTGDVTTYYGQSGEPVAQTLWQAWNYPVHSGYVVNGWWRIVWLVFALSPLALAVTGVSTWLVRLRTKRRRKAAARQRDALRAG